VTGPHLILGIGELLWDLLPQGPRLGGAPANFAVMAARLGDHAAILSRIGRDALGRQAVEQLTQTPVDTKFLAIDPLHATGSVSVSFSGGEPHYTIHEQVAWDFLTFPDEWIQLAQRADAICFGTLAQRSPQARRTVQALAAETPAACLRVFDVNLRAPFYSAEIVEESLELATVVKMNHEEAGQVLDLLGLAAEKTPHRASSNSKPLHAAATALLEEFPNLEMVAITRGKQGSLLVKRDEWNEHPGFQVPSADPIGAGDAFTAAVVHHRLRGRDLATLNEAGNRWGAWMASQSGAMPELPEAVRHSIDAAIVRAR
jgi:fructokinase